MLADILRGVGSTSRKLFVMQFTERGASLDCFYDAIDDFVKMFHNKVFRCGVIDGSEVFEPEYVTEASDMIEQVNTYGSSISIMLHIFI
jgi:hypothetical protein